MPSPHDALLDEHLAAENAHDLERIMATYGAQPMIVLNGQHIEGAAAIREFHSSFGFGGKPDASFSEVHVAETTRYHPGGSTIIIEQRVSALHTGTWRALVATGRRFEIPVCTVYVFDDAGKVAAERVYMDVALIERQLTVTRRRSRSLSLS
jgi:ketosteroid isomerase-like protein